MTSLTLSRDAMLVRLGVLFTIGCMVLQTLFMHQFTFLGNMTKSAFLRWVGLPCPLCGGTRAMNALFNGEWREALYLNWLAIPVLIIGIALVTVIGVELMFRRAILPAVTINRRRGLLLVSAFLLLWFLQIYQALVIPKPELLNPDGLYFKFRPFPVQH